MTNVYFHSHKIVCFAMAPRLHSHQQRRRDQEKRLASPAQPLHPPVQREHSTPSPKPAGHIILFVIIFSKTKGFGTKWSIISVNQTLLKSIHDLKRHPHIYLLKSNSFSNFEKKTWHLADSQITLVHFLLQKISFYL